MGSAIAWFARGHRWMTALALVATAGAWLWIWHQSTRAGAKPARSTLVTLGIATALLGLALIWPHIEPDIIDALRRT